MVIYKLTVVGMFDLGSFAILFTHNMFEIYVDTPGRAYKILTLENQKRLKRFFFTYAFVTI